MKFLMKVGLALALLTISNVAVANMDCCPTAYNPCCDPCYDPCCGDNFDGFYVGGNVGAIGHTANYNDLDGLLADSGSFTSTKTFVTGGVQAGYDWQCCNKVFGIVADWQCANPHHQTDVLPNTAGTDHSFKNRLRWWGTVRGRAGLAIDDVLVYVTAGWAYARIENEVNRVSPGVNDHFSHEKCRCGFAGGVGTEFAFWCCTRWSVNLEVLFLAFQKHRQEVVAPVFGAASFDHNDSAVVARVGLNWRFCL